MNPNRTFLTMALTATLALAQPGSAHIFTEWLPLEPVGYLDPFGHDTLQRYTDVASDGRRAWLSTRDRGVVVLALSAEGEPTAQANYAPSPLPVFTSVALSPDAVYLATDGDGIHVVDRDPEAAPRVRARIDSSNGGFDRAGRMSLHAGRLFVTSPESSEIAVFDVSDSLRPVRAGQLETRETGELRDIAIAGSHLYAAGTRGRDGRGAIYVYELNDLRAPARVFSTGLDSASVAITPDERFLVVSHARRGGSVTIHDLSATDPAQPLERIDAADYEINSFGPSLVRVKDQVAYVAWHQGGVQLIDLDTIDVTGRSQRVGVFGTAPGINPMAGAAGNVSAYPYVSDDRILLVDSRWGLYVVDARRVLPPPPAAALAP